MAILHGAPNLRVLKFIDVEFKTLESDDEPTRGIDIPSNVVLGALEELAIQELSVGALGIILSFLSAPNLQLLSCGKGNSIRSFIDNIRLKTLFSNLRRLNFQSVCPPDAKPQTWMKEMYSLMPQITSIHFDSASLPLARPLLGCSVSGIKRPSKTPAPKLLPALSEISVSGFSGNEIVKLVQARREQGLPVRVVCVDRGSIVSGMVSFEHWEILRGLVDTLRWFDTYGDSDQIRGMFIPQIGSQD